MKQLQSQTVLATPTNSHDLMKQLRSVFASGPRDQLGPLLEIAQAPHALDGLSLIERAFAEDFIGEVNKSLYFGGSA